MGSPLGAVPPQGCEERHSQPQGRGQRPAGGGHRQGREGPARKPLPHHWSEGSYLHQEIWKNILGRPNLKGTIVSR